jgi:cysteine desulfurase
MAAYLDHAATTPMRPEAVEAMLPFLTERFANPSGAHRLARDARRAIDEARDELAELLGCGPGEIVFTSGGTEADNLAIFGAGRADATGEAAPDGLAVCSAIEHHAVLDPVLAVGGRTVAVDRTGRLDLEDLEKVLAMEADRAAAGDGPGVRVVSVMAVNNEVGTLQPVEDVVAVVARHAPGAVVHVDAVQALCTTPVQQTCATADLLSLSAHKFGGPKGVGLLVVRETADVRPRQLGGGQERGRRSGTQDVGGIVAMATAARLAVASRDSEIARLAGLRDRLADGLLATVPDLLETGVPIVDGRPDRSGRAPHVVHVCVGDVESEALLYLLERSEVYASAASSCASGAMEASHVVAAMGVDPELAAGSLRLSLGWATTDAEIDHALEAIPPAIAQLRRFAL